MSLSKTPCPFVSTSSTKSMGRCPDNDQRDRKIVDWGVKHIALISGNFILKVWYRIIPSNIISITYLS